MFRDTRPQAFVRFPRRVKSTLVQLCQGRKPEILSGALCLAVVFAITHILYRRHYYVESENASFSGYFTPITAQISGEVSKVFARENQPIQKGQVLCQLDPKPYRLKVLEARAQWESFKARSVVAEEDASRADRLIREKAISAQEWDHARMRKDALAEQLKRANALLRQAELDFEKTTVIAPTEGTTAFRSATPGMYVRAGDPLFGFIIGDSRWVEAKIKETDLPDIRLGDQVRVKFDALPNRDFQGHVISIGPSTETPFAAVTPDFSAGNFSKYVQWYPIRIALSQGDPALKNMPIGATTQIQMKRD